MCEELATLGWWRYIDPWEEAMIWGPMPPPPPMPHAILSLADMRETYPEARRKPCP